MRHRRCVYFKISLFEFLGVCKIPNVYIEKTIHECKIDANVNN